MGTDDTVFLHELVDVVHILFLRHAEFAEISSFDKAQQRKLRCLHACQKYAEAPCEQNHVQVVYSWNKLGVRDKQKLRKVVRLSGTELRNEFLLELTGTKLLSEQTPPVGREVSVQGPDITHTRSILPPPKPATVVSL